MRVVVLAMIVVFGLALGALEMLAARAVPESFGAAGVSQEWRT